MRRRQKQELIGHTPLMYLFMLVGRLVVIAIGIAVVWLLVLTSQWLGLLAWAVMA